MRIRRTFAAVIATAALAGLGLAGAATATAAPTTQAAPSSVTPSECKQGGGTADLSNNVCKGGMYDGQAVD
ncbi:hypothetical protein CP980_18450 [Streptomyces vinaceus]|uniref:DUF320 domain-containing protein n=1 Tax=Streptomyces vinaceus TaxID=1960 RepID=A0A5J6JAK4_STRVI|nr:hypothetical protein [Streptomyces vinaceus]QEV46812.1 hypothetical protein CP980_18450 [Streptomyces vinaceus]GHE59485.1 hypothetical protein GCM10017778_50070 [Streptomyces vinaceus]